MARRVTDTVTGTMTVEGVDGEPEGYFRILNVDIPAALEPGDKDQVVIDWETSDTSRTHFINVYLGDEQVVEQEYSSMGTDESSSSFVYTMPTFEKSEIEWKVEIGVDE